MDRVIWLVYFSVSFISVCLCVNFALENIIICVFVGVYVYVKLLTLSPFFF